MSAAVGGQWAALGIDIGGTTVRAGLVSADGTLLWSATAATPPDGQPDELCSSVRRLAAEVCRGEPFAAAGVALPGIWDRATGVMRRAVNLPRLEGVNVVDLFTGALQQPVSIESDANAAGWAQWRQHIAAADQSVAAQAHTSASPPSAFSARNTLPQRCVYLSLGTGVGGCVILDGQIVRHTNGGAGHFGFLIVDPSPDAPFGRDGVRGSLASCIAAADLDTAAGLSAAGEALAVGIWQIAHVYLPDVFLFGGGVTDRWPQLVDAARAAFAARTDAASDIVRRNASRRPAHSGGRVAASGGCSVFTDGSKSPAGLLPIDLRIARAPLPSDHAGVIGAALLARS